MIRGIKNLNEELDLLTAPNLTAAIQKGISFVQEAAKAGCPVQDGELRESIFTSMENEGDVIRGSCYTNKEYAPYVEFGTGPKGQQMHDGISPDVAVAYSQSPWWIHESQIGREVAEKYHFFHIDTPQGRFYQCTGQAAQPFMYPALKDHEDQVVKIVADEMRRKR